MLENTQPLPLVLAGVKTRGSKVRRLLHGNFVVRNDYRLSSTIILTIQPHDCVRSCSGSSEEIQDDGVTLVRNEEAKNVFYGVERFWKRKFRPGRSVLTSLLPYSPAL